MQKVKQDLGDQNLIIKIGMQYYFPQCNFIIVLYKFPYTLYNHKFRYSKNMVMQYDSKCNAKFISYFWCICCRSNKKKSCVLGT